MLKQHILDFPNNVSEINSWPFLIKRFLLIFFEFREFWGKNYKNLSSLLCPGLTNLSPHTLVKDICWPEILIKNFKLRISLITYLVFLSTHDTFWFIFFIFGKGVYLLHTFFFYPLCSNLWGWVTQNDSTL